MTGNGAGVVRIVLCLMKPSIMSLAGGWWCCCPARKWCWVTQDTAAPRHHHHHTAAPSIHPACWDMQTAVSLSGYVKYCAVIGVWSSICIFCSSCKLLSDSSASLALVLCATGFRATVLSHTKVGHWFNILSSLYQCQKWTISGSRFTQQSATHHFIVYFQYLKDVKRRQCNIGGVGGVGVAVTRSLTRPIPLPCASTAPA